jgi:hypothetical protein
LNFEIHPVSAATIDSLLTEVYATPKDVLGRAAKTPAAGMSSRCSRSTISHR